MTRILSIVDAYIGSLQEDSDNLAFLIKEKPRFDAMAYFNSVTVQIPDGAPCLRGDNESFGRQRHPPQNTEDICITEKPNYKFVRSVKKK